MKRKLLLAALFAASALGLTLHAQQWTASTPADGGTYYLYNVGANAWLSNGYDTQAALKVKGGTCFTLSQNGESFDISSDAVYAGCLLTENVDLHLVFIDVAAGSYASYQPWTFEPVEGKEGTYTLKTGGRYLTIFQGSNTADEPYAFRTQTIDRYPNEMGYWQLVTKENRLAGAGQRNPVDATFLLGVADPRNTAMSTSAGWIKEGDGNINGGLNNFRCAEVFNSGNSNIYKTITNAPAGKYVVSVSGFYRAGGISTAASARKNGTEALGNAVLYANDVTTPLMSIFEEGNQNSNVGTSSDYGTIPNDMNNASAYFYSGCYSNNQVVITLAEPGDLTIGVKKTGTIGDDWTAFANFRITYYGDDTSAFTPVDYNASLHKYLSWSDVGSYNTSASYTRMRERYYSGVDGNRGTGVVTQQTITGLKNGVYEVTILANASWTSGRDDMTAQGDNGDLGRTVVFAGDKSQSVPVIDVAGHGVTSPYEWLIQNVEVTDHTLNVGMRREQGGSNWHIIRLKSVKLVAPLDVTALMVAYNAAKSKAEAVRDQLPTALKTVVQAVIEQSFDDTDGDEIEAQTNKLDAEATKYDDIITVYNKFKAIANAQSAITAQTNVYTDADGTKVTALSDAVSTASTAVEAATTVAAINTQIDALFAAYGTFVKETNIAGRYFDLTSLIVNPGFEASRNEGWTYSYDGQAFNWMTRETFHCVEFFNCTYNLSQTFSSMPAGTYKVVTNGFYRPNNQYNTAFHTQTNVDGYLYINTASKQLQVLRGNVTSITTAHNSMDNGEYLNELVATIAEGTDVTFGIKCENQRQVNSWTMVDDFRFYYTVDPADLQLDEKDATGPEAYDIANVTVTRTLKANVWNTLTLPFSMDTPAGWTVKALSGAEKDGEGVIHLNFTEATSIEAGVPYMVQVGESDVTSINANGVSIIATTTPTTADDVITFNGTFCKLADPGVPVGSYVINNNVFYVVEDGYPVSMNGFRAYLTPVAGGEVKGISYDFDDATAIKTLTPTLSTGDGAIYNVNGQRIQTLQRGINIVGGKKVLVK